MFFSDVQRAVAAVYLKHKGLVGDAISFAHALRKQKERKGDPRKKPRPAPPTLSELVRFTNLSTANWDLSYLPFLTQFATKQSKNLLFRGIKSSN